MTRIAMFVDGWNFYHSLSDAGISDYGWCDFELMARQQTRLPEASVSVKYFTAEDKPKPERRDRQRGIWWRALHYRGVEVIQGEFRSTGVEVAPEIRERTKWREKQTDIALASHMIADCNVIEPDSGDSGSRRWKAGYDRAVLLSGDTDFVPAVRILAREPYRRRVHVLLPPSAASAQDNAGRIWNREFETNDLVCVVQLRKPDLAKALLPAEVTGGGGKKVKCFPKWMWREKHEMLQTRQNR